MPQKPGQSVPATPKPSTSVTMKQTSLYSGPIPPSEEMERYHRINPDLVKQIVEMAKDEQKNRFEIEQKKLELVESVPVYDSLSRVAS